MEIEIKKVTKENLKEILSLHVKPSQKTYIETTKECLDDAKECDCYRPVGLYSDGILVGFAMYGFFPSEGNGGRVWLDRYLIDEHFQGCGLGNIMLETLINHLIMLYASDEIYLSIYDDNDCALHLYRKFGFDFNGELDINGEKVMVKNIRQIHK